MDENADTLAKVGISTEQAVVAFSKLSKIAASSITPEEMIAGIENNPTLNRFEKWRLIRMIRRDERS